MGRATHVDAPCYTRECGMSHTWMKHVTHMKEACHTCEYVKPRIWMRHITYACARSFMGGDVTYLMGVL